MINKPQIQKHAKDFPIFHFILLRSIGPNYVVREIYMNWSKIRKKKIATTKTSPLPSAASVK